MPSNQSTHLFANNFKFLKIFGVWGGRKPSKYYKYYSAFYLFVTFLSYNVLLTINLIYTPRKIELAFPEIIFYFAEVNLSFNVFTIITMRDKIIKALDVIDCDNFMGDYKSKGGILWKVHVNYKKFWILLTMAANLAFFILVLVPIFTYLIQRKKVPELPICKYYFLTDEDRRKYYIFWFIYQSLGMYGHMTCNTNIHTFIIGLLAIAVSQLRLLNSKINNIKLTEQEKTLHTDLQDQIMLSKLNDCIKQHETILMYHQVLQKMLSSLIFFHCSLSSLIICIATCGLFWPSSIELKVFFIMYSVAMITEIFIPAFLGSQICHESQELGFAAYNIPWYVRSKAFNRNLWLFMERTKQPLMITGLDIVPLSLTTFTSIMKSAYSFFTLIINFQKE